MRDLTDNDDADVVTGVRSIIELNAASARSGCDRLALHYTTATSHNASHGESLCTTQHAKRLQHGCIDDRLHAPLHCRPFAEWMS